MQELQMMMIYHKRLFSDLEVDVTFLRYKTMQNCRKLQSSIHITLQSAQKQHDNCEPGHIATLKLNQ